MSNQPLISIIVPVYNAKLYLGECIASILSSTFQNLEVILVDDGSTDNSSAICDQYAQENHRIRVIHQENKGIIEARNAGVEIAQGEFIGFVDADDVVSPLLYEKLMSVMYRENADIVACEYCRKREDLVVSQYEKLNHSYIFRSFDEQLAVLTCEPSIREYTWTGPYVWNKLYRREKISFFCNECLMCEDLKFNWDYIRKSRKMVVIPEKLYWYRVNKESIMGIYTYQKYDKVNINKGISNATLWAFIASNSSVESPKLKTYLEARSAYVAHSALWRIYFAKLNREYLDFIVVSKKIIHDHGGKILRDKKTYDFRLRIVIGVCRYCFPIWKIAIRLSSIKKGISFQ